MSYGNLTSLFMQSFLRCHTVLGVSWAYSQTFSIYKAAGKDLTFLGFFLTL